MRRLETPNGRTATFDYPNNNFMGSSLQDFCVILPDDDWVYSLKMMDLIEPHCHRVQTWDRRGWTTDMDLTSPESQAFLKHIVATSRTEAIKRIRKEPRRDAVVAPHCLQSLDINIKFDDSDYEGYYPILWFGIGTTVLGSQLSTIMFHLPHLPCFTIDDKEGEMGVILGHIKETFISEPKGKKNFASRVQSGPRSYIIDKCPETFNKAYYIHSLGSDNYLRPKVGSLTFVYNGKISQHKVAGVLKEGDYILDRGYMNDRTLILQGLPTMSPTDFWFLSKYKGFGYDINDYLPLPKPKTPTLKTRSFFSISDYSPVSRVAKTYGLTRLTSSDLLRVTKQYIHDYEVRTNYLGDSEDDVPDEEDSLREDGIVSDKCVDFGRGYDSPFLLSAWTSNYIETRSNFVTWHRAGNHIVHINNIDFNCGCENPKPKKYFGPVPLVKLLVKGICLGLPL